MAPRTPRLAHVVSTTPITPHMVRVVLGGEGLAGFDAGAFTDHYVKLQLPPQARRTARRSTSRRSGRASRASTGRGRGPTPCARGTRRAAS